MSGADAIRGIAYQQAQAILVALDVLDDTDASGIRVEGKADVVDIEVISHQGQVTSAKQIKTRLEGYTWGRLDLLPVFRKWSELPDAADASFEFVTDGRIGPSGDEVIVALDEARAGDLSLIRKLFVDAGMNAQFLNLNKARIHRDPASVEKLLSRAERQIVSIMMPPRTDLEAREQAADRINALFRLLFERASKSNIDAHFIGRAEIAATLHVPADQSPAQRWPGSLKQGYLDVARNAERRVLIHGQIIAEAITEVILRSPRPQADPEPLDVSAILNCSGFAILCGRTGSGKSTSATILRMTAASNGTAVLYAHAESYLSGRLDALAADAISELVGIDLPASTGRQALSDDDVILTRLSHFWRGPVRAMTAGLVTRMSRQ